MVKRKLIISHFVKVSVDEYTFSETQKQLTFEAYLVVTITVVSTPCGSSLRRGFISYGINRRTSFL